MSRCSSASMTRSSWPTTRSSPPSADASRRASSSWKCARWPKRRTPGPGSAELAGDVLLGALIVRGGEDLVGGGVLDELADPLGLVRPQVDGEERGAVRDAGRLLHVVRDDHDREVLLELEHELLDAAGRDRVERRARLVHEDHVGLDGERPRDAEALLLAAGHAVGVLLEAVLNVVPERGAAQRALDDLVHRALHAEHARPERDVVG